MGKTIKVEDLTPTLHLAECTDGWWLYDDTRGMNLSMGATTRESAFIKTIEYYQGRLAEIESNYRQLKGHVDSFVNLFADEE